MSTRPSRLCPRGHIVPAGTRCAPCTKAQDQVRGNASKRGYGARHRAWRAMVLARYHKCAMCKAPPRNSDHADHIIPLPQPNWWDGDWSIENGQRLCHICHNIKTAKERTRVA